MNNVTYAFVSDETTVDDVAFESKVSSFGIDHVTRKDLLSFYLNFSGQAYFDSGLLPVDGTGMLSIRTAGNHTQVGYQYAPGKFHINWGAYERDPNAANIYVAQPYRIVIADIVDGNLYGARTFYSPIPVQHPDTPLYHVNLPNINCRGYRGNGVGWICLYHTEDISSFPFNEKLIKILERCSGVEAYNDQNMSETDGPRFYKDYYKPDYVYDPQLWEKYTEENGVDWVLNPDLWIPVLVKDMDNQDKHYNNGVPLTYVQAILGNYKAYYTDTSDLKPVNAIARGSFGNKDVFKFFRKTYNDASNFGSILKDNNVYNASLDVREKNSKIFVATPMAHVDQDENEEEDNLIECDYCSDEFDKNNFSLTVTHEGTLYCDDCIGENATWVEHMGEWYTSADNLMWNTYTEQHYDSEYWEDKVVCNFCGIDYAFDSKAGISAEMLPLYKSGENYVCISCTNEAMSTIVCAKCNNERVPEDNITYEVNQLSRNGVFISICNHCFHANLSPAEKNMAINNDTRVKCICGKCVEFSHMKKAKSAFGHHSIANVSALKVNSDIVKALKDDLNLDINHKLISNYSEYKMINKLNEPIKVINAYAQSNEFCPDCINDIQSNGLSQYQVKIFQEIDQNLIDMYEDESINTLYGTTLKVIPFF